MRLNRPSALAEGSFRARKLLPVLAAVSLAACNFPTEPIEVEQRWVVPLEETRFGVAELLDANEVTVNADSSAFLVAFDPVQFQETLGTLCAACVDGTTVPKPPFLNSFDSDVALPSTVSAVSLSSGQVEVVLENGFNFDPLRPGGGLTGDITIEIIDSSDGESLGTLQLDGATEALPAFTTRTETIALAAATIEGSLRATVTVNSPLGDPVTLDNGLFITATATPTDIVVSGASVDVSGEAVDLDPVELDLEDVDETVSDQLRCDPTGFGSTGRCSFVLDVQNPFGIASDFTLRIIRPGLPDLVKSALVSSSATSVTRVNFTDAEVRSLLGRAGVRLEGSAAVSPTAGVISVSPGDELVLEAQLDATISVGG